MKKADSINDKQKWKILEHMASGHTAVESVERKHKLVYAENWTAYILLTSKKFESLIKKIYPLTKIL